MLMERQKIINTIEDLERLTIKNDEKYYYIRNKAGVICAIREKKAYRFRRKCQYYKTKYTQEEFLKLIKDKSASLIACYNYLYPDDMICITKNNS